MTLSPTPNLTPKLSRMLNVAAVLLLCGGTAVGGGSPGVNGHGSPAKPEPTKTEQAKTEQAKTLRMGAAAKDESGQASGEKAGQTKPAPTTAAPVAAGKAPVDPHASSGSEAAPSAAEALAWLKEGNARFVKQHAENPNTGAERISETASGQRPFASVLSCADSRVPVERVFDRGVGDLFVVRVAGNIAGESEMGTLEYGTGHLHTPLLVVMGHTSCGAVAAAASGAELHGAVGRLVGRIRPSVEEAREQFPELKPDQITPIAIRVNVMRTIETLMTQSEEIGGLVREGKLEIVGAVYDLNSGTVHFLGGHPEQTALLNAPAARAGQAQAEAREPDDKGGH